MEKYQFSYELRIGAALNRSGLSAHKAGEFCLAGTIIVSLTLVLR